MCPLAFTPRHIYSGMTSMLCHGWIRYSFGIWELTAQCNFAVACMEDWS